MGAIDQLGYLAFEVSDLERWETFATEVLGLVVAQRWDGGLSLRMDGHAQRLFIAEGPSDDLAAIGWQIDEEERLEATVAQLRDAGYDVVEAAADRASRRQVVRLFEVTDPAGIQVELYFGPTLAEEPFESELVPGGFVADEHGLGHLVINAPNQEETGRFYRELLGFKLSDRITCEYYGVAVDITFLHTNPRHHSLAFGGPQEKRLHHFMLEVKGIDVVGAAMDRAVKHRVRLAQTIGRHPNDRMVSFYAYTPSGFQFELGTGGRIIDDETWEPTTYDRISEWGHLPPEMLVPRRRKPKEPNE